MMRVRTATTTPSAQKLATGKGVTVFDDQLSSAARSLACSPARIDPIRVTRSCSSRQRNTGDTTEVESAPFVPGSAPHSGVRHREVAIRLCVRPLPASFSSASSLRGGRASTRAGHQSRPSTLTRRRWTQGKHGERAPRAASSLAQRRPAPPTRAISDVSSPRRARWSIGRQVGSLR